MKSILILSLLLSVFSLQTEFIKYEERESIAIITINRPKALNALNSKVLDELDATLDSIDTEIIKAVILTGAGEKSFVAGADIAEMSNLNKKEGEFSIEIIKKDSKDSLSISEMNNQLEINIGEKSYDKILGTYKMKRKINLNGDLYPDYNFIYIEIYLSYHNGATITSAIVVDSLYNKYYDISYNGNSISSKQTHIYSGCISQFSSGGKNDKDACRNNLKIKCGNEIDYRCKESGLYDIILENPIFGLILPKECNKGNKNECMKWIDKNLFNYLTLRYSSFSGFSLMVDAASRGYIQDTNNQEYVFHE